MEVWDEHNDPQWMKPHLKALLAQVRARQAEGHRDKRLVERLMVSAPGANAAAYPSTSQRLPAPLPPTTRRAARSA